MALEPVLDGVWRWRWFSEEKGMDFNGWALALPAGLAVVDPAWADEATWEVLAGLGAPAGILLTNKDHERASDELRLRLGTEVWAHAEEAPLLAVPPGQTFADGERLFGALETVRLRGLKSPAECALHWPARRLLLVGDAVAGHPPGGLGLVKKHQGRPEVLDGLRRLLDLDFDVLLVGDGQPLLVGAKDALRRFLG